MSGSLVMLAQPKKKQTICGYFASAKLDGIRAFWDGGVSRGVKTSDVPWANVEKDKKETVATGLWSRLGKVIYAPKWFLDLLPKGLCCDGELWVGPNKWQQTSSIVKTQDGTTDWHPVKYMIYDFPPPEIVFLDRVINETHYKKTLKGCYQWWASRSISTAPIIGVTAGFASRLKWGTPWVGVNENVRVHTQKQLSWIDRQANEEANVLLEQALLADQEGLILKSSKAMYETARSHMMLKYKPFTDMECTVVGYTTGRETDKGSKLLGMMGALICTIGVDDGTKQFKVSGFTDWERRLWCPNDDPEQDRAEAWATAHPDEVCPHWIENPMFPRGKIITIKYRELSDGLIPKEGRYWRDFVS